MTVIKQFCLIKISVLDIFNYTMICEELI